MNSLQSAGLIFQESRIDLLGNALVIITSTDAGPSISKAEDLAGANVKHLALADPAAVPAGIYAKAFLVKTALWPLVKDKLIPTENVRAAMAMVESGNADAGFVYRTDAGTSKKVKIAVEIPAVDAPLIRYPAALLKDSSNRQASAKFLSYLSGAEARAEFVRYGFEFVR